MDRALAALGSFAAGLLNLYSLARFLLFVANALKVDVHTVFALFAAYVAAVAAASEAAFAAAAVTRAASAAAFC
jgi:hypothetical protein